MTSFDAAFRSDISPKTGFYKSTAEAVVKSVRAFIRSNNATAFYIGITSSGEVGLRNRWNAKYKALGFDQIVPLYQSDSLNFVRNLEDFLIKGFSHYDSLNNAIAGGGGNTSTNKPYLVYIAFKKGRDTVHP